MSKKNPRKSKRNQAAIKESFFNRVDRFFYSKSNLIFWISFGFTLLFSFLLFNFRVSEAGDDSAYIVRAYDFIKEGIFPAFQGPLYPMVLSLFIWIFGLNITLLKFLSLIALVFHLYLFYKAFKGKVSSTILSFTLIIISFNSYLLYYSSQTFNEAFFMLLQASLFLLFFKVISKNKEDAKWFDYLIIGMFLFLLGITKTIGFSALFAALVFLLLEKRWKGSLITFFSFVGFYMILSLVKKYFFDVGTAQFESQLNTLLQVNPYDASEGVETFSGFIQRFLINSKLYLSKHFLNFLGLKQNLSSSTISLTILVYLIFFISFIFSFKKNRYILFTGLYLLFMCGATFLSLQTRWDQDRLIIPFFPLMLIFLLSGIHYLGEIKKLRWIHAFMIGFFVIVFFANLSVTTKRVKQNNDFLINGLAGNQFYGMTPDWVNYIKMSQWAAENIPDKVAIACRKPSVSFIYAQRKFRGIYRIPTENADTLLKNLKDQNVHYVIMGNLRKYPNQKTEYTINTVQRYLYYIQVKYPEKIRHIHTIGLDEKAYLFQIAY